MKEKQKRKKVHSPFRNFLYKISRNGFFYAALTLVIATCFIIGVIVNKDVGKIENLPDTTKNSTVRIDEPDNLEVCFLDVGQGDATLIKFPDGKTMLIDGGRTGADTERILDKYLTDENGDKLTIDYCVATHSDEDHVGSLGYVYKNYTVLNSFRPYVKALTSDVSDGFNDGKIIKDTPSDAYGDYVAAAEKEKCYYEYFDDSSDFTNTVICGDQTFTYSVDFVLPYAAKYTDFEKFDDSNDFSAVIAVSYAGKRILLCGDMGKDRETDILNAYRTDPIRMKCDVLKVAHHGSENSSGRAFISAVDPDYAVISCGLENSYGHPSKKVVDELLGKATIYRTDMQGVIKLVITADPSDDIAFSVECDKNDDYLYYSPAEYAPYINIIKGNKKR